MIPTDAELRAWKKSIDDGIRANLSPEDCLSLIAAVEELKAENERLRKKDDVREEIIYNADNGRMIRLTTRKRP